MDGVKAHPLYDPTRVHAFVHDLTSTASPTLKEKIARHVFAPATRPGRGSAGEEAAEDSLNGKSATSLEQRPRDDTDGDRIDRTWPDVDIVSCLFVMSAIPPEKMTSALQAMKEVSWHEDDVTIALLV